MNDYPFYTPIQEESVTIGSRDTITIPKYCDVTLAEKLYVKELLRNLEDTTIIVGKLATAVARSKNIPPKLAATIVWGTDDDTAKREIKEAKIKLTPEAVREEFYLDILKSTGQITEYSEARKSACVEALVHCRLTKDPTATAKLMSKFSDTLINEIFDFWLKEEAHWENVGK